MTTATTPSADGPSSQTEYDLLGRVDAVIDARGNRTTYGYDLAGRRTSVTDARFESSSYVHDARGNQLSFTDALGHVTSFEYDAKSRRTRTVFHDGSAMSVVYDALDRKVSETDQAGITTAFQYDELGRLASVTDALNEVTSYGYDEQGSRTLQTDALGRNTQWSYDHLGRALKRTLPLGMFESMSYDGVGNLTARTDFNGHTTSYQHDIHSRLQAMTFADGSSQSYGYNESGLRTRSTTADGDTLYFYDLQDRLIHQENPDGTWLAYTYDQAGNRTSVETANGLTSFTFDQLNRLETVTAPDGEITVYSYDAVGNRQSIQHGNGTQTLYVYDDLNRLIHMEHQNSGGAVLASYDYTLGLAGNRLNVTDHTGRVVAYSYDDLYRLTREDITDPINGNAFFAYTYDAVANRVTKEDVNGVVTSTYDDNDRILTEGVNAYTYDLNGNTLTATKAGVTTNYTYDYQNRMIGANDGSKLVNYGYNADGIRRWSEVDGVRTTFLVDQNRPYAQVLEELDAGFNPTVTYVHGDDLLSQFRTGQRYTYHYDGHGSTTALTDTTEAVTDTYTYDAWGELLASTGSTPNNYLYTGEQYDPNVGFYYLRARYYNPSLGRFHTMDTWVGRLLSPLTLNKYTYVNSSPVDFIDPSGRFLIEQAVVNREISHTRLLEVQAGIMTKQAVLGGFFAVGLTYDHISAQTQTSLQFKRQIKRQALKIRNEVKTRVEEEGEQGSQLLFHYTPTRASALNILGTQQIWHSDAARDPFTGQLFPQGAYATNIAPWTPGMTKTNLKRIMYFNPDRQLKQKVDHFVVLINRQQGAVREFRRLGFNQFVKEMGTDVLAIFAGPTPMPE